MEIRKISAFWQLRSNGSCNAGINNERKPVSIAICREIARKCSELVGRSDFSRLRPKIAQNLAIPLLHEGDLAGLKRPGLRSLEPKW